MGVFWVFKSESILPIPPPHKNRQYDGQTKTPDSFRLLLVEVLHLGKVSKNEEYRKKSFPDLALSVGSSPDFDT